MNKIISMNILNLYLIRPDSEGTIYIYSDGLFDWFYDRIKYISDDTEMFIPFIFDPIRTKEDNKNGGCRIWTKEGYDKFYETFFLMEFSEHEWNEINMIKDGLNENNNIKKTMIDIVNYYYIYNEADNNK